MRDIIHRIGASEVAIAKLQISTADHATTLADHEPRIRKVEHLQAKIIGACLAGSALGNIILSLITK